MFLRLESVFHELPVILQEIEQRWVTYRTTSQHTVDQMDIRVREVHVVAEDRDVQKPGDKLQFPQNNVLVKYKLCAQLRS